MKSLIISDVHGNWPALQAVLEAESNFDQVICLGVLVNYGPQPAECVSWAMGLGPPNILIQGNHDRAFSLLKPVCNPIDPPFAEEMQAATSNLLTSEMKTYLAGLQPAREFSRGTTKCAALHAELTEWHLSYTDEMNPQWPWESDIIVRGHPDALFLLIGHPDIMFFAGAHVPFKVHWATTLTVNPGSVGCPLDGDPRAAYALWDGSDITLRRVEYNVEATVAALERLNLDSTLTEYAARGLRMGGNRIQRIETTGQRDERNTPKIDSIETTAGKRTKRNRRGKPALSNLRSPKLRTRKPAVAF
jgi:predicted phosphodiesterase